MSQLRRRTIYNPDLRGGEITVARYYPSLPGFATLPLRSRVAWRLRYWADKLDNSLSYTLNGKWPAGMRDEDLFDALCFGGSAMQKYMTDIFRERSE